MVAGVSGKPRRRGDGLDRVDRPPLRAADGQSAGAHEAERICKRGLHFTPIDDEVEHPFFQEELTSLKALGQFLADRLLDHARPRETDERFGLGDVQVAEHREARGRAP